MLGVVKNRFRQSNNLWVNFTTDVGKCSPETSFVLIILRNKEMVKIKTFVIILKIIANFIVDLNLNH